MTQVEQIKKKQIQDVTHADVKLMITHNQHEWLAQHQADLPDLVLREPGPLPRMSVEVWNDNPSVKRQLAILEWYAAAYTIGDDTKPIIIDDSVALLDACFADELYARNNEVIAVALVGDIIESVNQQCKTRSYQIDENMQRAPYWARSYMAVDILIKSKNVFNNDQLGDDEIKSILAVMSRFLSNNYFVYLNKEKLYQYVESLIESSISAQMSERIARISGGDLRAEWKVSSERLGLRVSRDLFTQLSTMLRNKSFANKLRAKLTSNEPLALFELLLPSMANEDMDYGNRFVKGSRIWGYFHKLLGLLKVAPSECLYQPYRDYLNHEFNVRFATERGKFGYKGNINIGYEPVHNEAFFIRCHARLSPENLRNFSLYTDFQIDPEWSPLELSKKYEVFASALTHPGLSEDQLADLHRPFEKKEFSQCMLKLLHLPNKFSTDSEWSAENEALLKHVLIYPNFPCDQTYALKLKGDKDAINLAKGAKPIALSLLEAHPKIAQALFDKIVLGGGCFLLNLLMTNSKLTEVRYNTDTMKDHVIPLMKGKVPSPAAISSLVERSGSDHFSLRDALMVLMFVQGEDDGFKAACIKAFGRLDAVIDKAELKALVEAMIFIGDDAKANLVAHLSPKGAPGGKNHQRLLSDLGLKPSFIAHAMTTFSDRVNQAVVDRQVDGVKTELNLQSDRIFGL